MDSVIFKKPPLKKLEKEGLFGVDMHFHTRYSLDGISHIPSAVKKAQKKGFGFAITDHNTVDGVIKSYRLRKHTLIIPGIELTCNNGNHILAYFYDHKNTEDFFNRFLKPRMKRNPFFIDISPAEIIQFSKDHDFLVCAPHPFGTGAVGMMNTGVTKKIERSIKMVEVLNGFNFRKANIKAIDWAKKNGKAITGGSDGHSTYELGKVLTFTKGDDIESVFKEIQQKRSVVIGKEDNLFLKAAMSIRKEGAYVNRSKKQKMASTLLGAQFGSELRYMNDKFKKSRAYHMLTHHHEELTRRKR